jgi:hypothetical protein
MIAENLKGENLNSINSKTFFNDRKNQQQLVPRAAKAQLSNLYYHQVDIKL